MEVENKKPRYPSLFNWLHKEDKQSYSLSEIEDGVEVKSDDYDLSIRSLEFDPYILTNELRIFVGTWNVGGRSPVGSLAVDLEDWLNIKNAADMYVLGFQEIVPLKTLTVIGAEDTTVATSWNQLIGRTLNKNFGHQCSTTPMLNSSISSCNDYPNNEEGNNNNNNEYKLVASKKMVGVFISVWLRTEVMRKYCVSNVRVCSVACGVMGYLGNKGSVAVSMAIEGTSFCFVGAHLASGEKKGDEGRRNHQVAEIFRRTCFSRTTKLQHHYPHPLTILGHDRIFWFGDLNYRLYSEDNVARHMIRKQDWKALQEFDQLQKELEEGGVFEGWKEGIIEFAPTYKYSSSNRYCGGLPSRYGEKQRTPAWCDRILWYGKGVEQLHYLRSESKFSDHRPVSAIFSTQIEIVSSRKELVELQSIPSTMLHPNHGVNNGDEDRKSTLLSLLIEDIQGC
ncbi:hypothetical protein RIF29_18889 [Crotalaria pallida]|uniref:Inositol polyphosphate-related phosphatase domain-containing protein n=1 Tax=Crotalaria pallida TaxID=3830 RepID=A0AAN9EYZ8_CROPI